MMNCNDARGRLNPYLDGELEMDENVEVVRHLEGCSACSSVFEGERALFDEVRRQASGPSAPPGLRDRIAGQIAKSRPAARPWPFARALVPAAAAAVLAAVLVTFLAPGPLNAETLANRAVAWHEHPLANAALISGVPEILSYFAGKGEKTCMHEKVVGSGMEYGYKSACLDKAGPAGTVTCWWTAACPKSGTRMTHARFPVSADAAKTLVDNPKRRISVGSRVVLMHYQSGFV